MSENPTIEHIRQAADDRARADDLKREATERLRIHVERAKAEGVPISQIAREARLTRQAVYDLLRPS